MKGAVPEARLAACVALACRVAVRSLVGVSCACWAGAASAQDAAVLSPAAKDAIAQQVEPLKDWQDPAFGDAVAIEYGCGHVLEARLLRTPRANYADVVVLNSTEAASRLLSAEARVVFDSGRERRLSERFGAKEELEPQGSQRLFFEFPNKEDFGEEAALRITLPLRVDAQQECKLVAELARAPGYRDDARTTTIYEAANFYLAAGGGVSRSGNMKGLGKPFVVATGTAIYPWARHGWYVELGLGRHNVPALDPLGLTENGFSTFRVGGSAGYAFRYRLGSSASLAYQAGLGLQRMVLEANDAGSNAPSLEEETQAFAMHRLGLDLDADWGPVVGGLGLGLAVQHRYTAAGSIAGLPLDGHTVSLLVVMRGF